MSFRPDSIGKIFGQDHLIDTIQLWLSDKTKVPQSILFQGSYGCGKTTIARMLANSLISTTKDLSEINMSDSRGIDDVRSLIESLRYSPFGVAKVFILDELHQLTQAAQSAFLKALEEPPKGTYFFLCTTEPSKLLPTIRSRCTSMEVRLLNKEASIELMDYLSKGRVPAPVMESIHLKSGGHARDIVKLLDLAQTQNVQTTDQLDKISGISQDQVTNSLKAVASGAVLTKEQVELIRQAEDPMLASCIDSLVDDLAYNGSPIGQKYFEFLQIRTLRKDYKISAREQLAHFYSTSTAVIRLQNETR